MATIREISERAGVSIATVSKVLNGKPGVKQETADEILAIANELNYRPNLNARFLKSGRSQTLGIITEDLTVFNSPEIVDGIAVACEKRGYHYILGNLRFDKRYGNGSRDEKESSQLLHSTVNDMLSKQVDGIIYVGCHSHVVVSLADHADIPFVCAYCTSSDPHIHSVLYDDRTAACEATKVLIQKGVQQIGMITGPMDSIHSINRMYGFQDALFQAGIPYNPKLTANGDWNRESGYRFCASLIKEGAKGIFAHNDLIATGVIDWCNRNNIVVGKDIYLIGFDNREISTVSHPSLSTVALPLFDIGFTAGSMLLDTLAGETNQEQEVLLNCTIIERESTGSFTN
ncbi:MAG: LacI family DNA-binding transcriptional regulator [Lachnospiraceae bacterium]|nr:LacI family DNA-binding transcriptional regulator [Lachnospiraceae bacterium]